MVAECLQLLGIHFMIPSLAQGPLAQINNVKG